MERLEEKLTLSLVNHFRGEVQDRDALGVCEIKFPSLGYAAKWAKATNVSDRVRVVHIVWFNEPVIVEYFTR